MHKHVSRSAHLISVAAHLFLVFSFSLTSPTASGVCHGSGRCFCTPAEAGCIYKELFLCPCGCPPSSPLPRSLYICFFVFIRRLLAGSLDAACEETNHEPSRQRNARYATRQKDQRACGASPRCPLMRTLSLAHLIFSEMQSHGPRPCKFFHILVMKTNELKVIGEIKLYKHSRQGATGIPCAHNRDPSAFRIFAPNWEVTWLCCRRFTLYMQCACAVS